MIAALVLCTARVALAQNVVGGDWQSILKLGSVELCVVLHIAQGNNGALKATDSVDQGINGTPVTSIVVNGFAFAQLRSWPAFWRNWGLGAE